MTMPPDWLYTVFLTVLFVGWGAAIQLDLQDESKLTRSAPYWLTFDLDLSCTCFNFILTAPSVPRIHQERSCHRSLQYDELLPW